MLDIIKHLKIFSTSYKSKLQEVEFTKFCRKQWTHVLAQ